MFPPDEYVAEVVAVGLQAERLFVDGKTWRAKNAYQLSSFGSLTHTSAGFMEVRPIGTESSSHPIDNHIGITYTSNAEVIEDQFGYQKAKSRRHG